MIFLRANSYIGEVKDFCELEQKMEKVVLFLRFEHVIQIEYMEQDREKYAVEEEELLNWPDSDAVPKTAEQANLCAEICPSRRVGQYSSLT